MTRRSFTSTENTFAKGSNYGPLQSDGYSYLCPECGGYGFVADDNAGTCKFCNGTGELALTDERIHEEGGK